MKEINREKLKSSERFFNNGLLTEEEIDQAIEVCLKKIDHNITKLGEKFPTPATKDNSYESIDNIEWTNGFWTGILWLAYEYTLDNKYRKLAEKNVTSFLNRIQKNIEVEHHDLGFLYSLSCVSAFKLTGSSEGYTAGIMAADKLLTRYQEKGKFIQAWGEFGKKENYRLIVDCLLNIPLLYWATEVTGNSRYKEVADAHYETTINYAIRSDSSAYHTFYFDPETGEPIGGKTHQGYSDDSSWARGQSWLIYGMALNQAYNKKEETLKNFEAVTNYFLNRLPKDFICYWDLIFDDTDQQPKDSSAAAVAICGLNLMDRYLPETNQYKLTYKYAQHAMMRSLIAKYTSELTNGITALLDEGVYSWHSGKGVNEGNIWGDYYYLEALLRFKKDWTMYW